MPDDRPVARGPDPLWDMILDKRFLPAIDATTEKLMLDLHRRVVELERRPTKVKRRAKA